MNDNIYEEKISGVVENVVFHNTTNLFTVLEINVSGEIVTAVGTFSETAPGEELVLSGTWGSHEVFGRQLSLSVAGGRIMIRFTVWISVQMTISPNPSIL